MALANAAADAATELKLVESARSAERWLGRHYPFAILVDSASPDARAAAVNARARASYARVPVIALTRELGDLTFSDTFNWGGDDAVNLNHGRPLVARLRALRREGPACRVNGGGKAVILDPDRSRRVALGRVLHNAGYSVTFAERPAELQQSAQSQAPDLVVAGSELGQLRPAIQQARSRGIEATWIVTCPPRELGVQRKYLADLPRVAATDGYAPPENVLFLANELKNETAANQRASKRVLFGTTVQFRGAGRDEDDVGFTYNISEGGFYVRTLAPPDDEDVWLELRPPRAERRVRLVGKVAWRRRFGANERATVPPGFGIQIVDGARMDLDTWRAGYRSFAEALGALPA